MQRASIAWGVFVAVGVAALIGCAEGTDGDTGVSDLGTLPAEAGKGDENSVSLPPSSQPKEEEDAGTGGEGDDAGGGGGTDSGGGGGTDAGVDSGGGGTTSCTSPNACLGATDLGSVSGDTGADVKTAQGSGSQWFKVRVTEDDSDIFGLSLLVKAELTSPPGTNFDVFVYVAGNGSGQECTVVSASSTNPTTFDSASKEWGEGTISNGNDDGRNVTIEVRWVSGTCSPSAKWTLTVRGDVP